MFQLPSLKTICKYKLSSARFRQVEIVKPCYPGKIDHAEFVIPVLTEHCVSVETSCCPEEAGMFISALTNRGDLELFSVSGLKRQLRSSLAKHDSLMYVLNLTLGNNFYYGEVIVVISKRILNNSRSLADILRIYR